MPVHLPEKSRYTRFLCGLLCFWGTVLFCASSRSPCATRGKLMANARLVNEKGEELLLSSIPLDENLSRVGDVGTVGLSLPFKSVSAGEYILLVEASDGASPEPLMVRTDLELVNE